jgi:transposase
LRIVSFAADQLPADPDALRALLMAERARHAQEIAAVRAEANGEIERLAAIIKDLQRHRFGPRSERVDPDQLALMLEDVEQALAAAEAEVEQQSKTAAKASSRKRRANRGALPAHLPREEIVVDIVDKACPCCGGARHVIGEDVSERLDVTPARFKVLVMRRPKYACRACEGEVAQAAAPERLIEAGIPTEALVAHVIVSKYGDHQPLYRQAQIYGRQGLHLDRSTLADWVGRAAFALRPVHERLLAILKSSTKLFADETPAPVLDPGRRRIKTGQFWTYGRDDRPWAGPDPPAVVYVYAPDRKHERPVIHLAGFTGVLQVDGYGAYERLAETGAATLAFCWAHLRRAFYKIHENAPAPIAAEMLVRIGALYDIEREIRGRSAEERQAVRQARARPILEAMKVWLEAKLLIVSGKATIADAIRYALSRWEGFTRYIDDGRIEIDSNSVERAMKPIALGRKNHLFAGSDGGAEHWAVLASLIETCKLNRIDPQAYLADVLSKIINRHPASRIDELLPFAYLDRSQRAAA